MKQKGYQKHLVECPQCKREVLDHMETCPFCDYALKKEVGMTKTQIKSARRILNIIGFVLAAALILWRVFIK